MINGGVGRSTDADHPPAPARDAASCRPGWCQICRPKCPAISQQYRRRLSPAAPARINATVGQAAIAHLSRDRAGDDMLGLRRAVPISLLRLSQGCRRRLMGKFSSHEHRPIFRSSAANGSAPRRSPRRSIGESDEPDAAIRDARAKIHEIFCARKQTASAVQSRCIQARPFSAMAPKDSRGSLKDLRKIPRIERHRIRCVSGGFGVVVMNRGSISAGFMQRSMNCSRPADVIPVDPHRDRPSSPRSSVPVASPSTVTAAVDDTAGGIKRRTSRGTGPRRDPHDAPTKLWRPWWGMPECCDKPSERLPARPCPNGASIIRLIMRPVPRAGGTANEPRYALRSRRRVAIN